MSREGSLQPAAWVGCLHSLHTFPGTSMAGILLKLRYHRQVARREGRTLGAWSLMSRPNLVTVMEQDKYRIDFDGGV
jgi:hypothetical protein